MNAYRWFAALALGFACSALYAGPIKNPDREKPRRGPGCEANTPEGLQAVGVVHSARDGSASHSAEVVKTMLPKITEMLASEKDVNNQWLHAAVDLGKELVRHKRVDEARTLFTRIVELDGDGEWGPVAAGQLKELPAKN